MSRQCIIILGTNGNCMDIAETVELRDEMEMLGFLDDAGKGTCAGYPILGGIEDAAKFASAHFVCGIGSARSYQGKAAIIARTGVPLERWATVIHPTAVVSRQAEIGLGSVLLSHVSVGAGAVIGNHVMVLQGSVISHDSVVHDHSVLASGVCLSGHCGIWENVYLGSRSTLREGVQVGSGSLVGMGSVVLHEVPAGKVVCGNPAQILR